MSVLSARVTTERPTACAASVAVHGLRVAMEGLNLLLHQIDLLGGQHQEVGLLMKHLLGRIRRDDVAP